MKLRIVKTYSYLTKSMIYRVDIKVHWFSFWEFDDTFSSEVIAIAYIMNKYVEDEVVYEAKVNRILFSKYTV